MKNFISIAIILSFTLIFTAATTQSETNIEISIKSIDLNNRDVISKLIGEFNRLAGVVHAESSIKTNTLMIIYNDSFNVSQKQIEDIFLKWGCNHLDISYSLINWFLKAILNVYEHSAPIAPIAPPIIVVASSVP